MTTSVPDEAIEVAARVIGNALITRESMTVAATRALEVAAPLIAAVERERIQSPERMARDFHEAAGLTLPEAPTLDIGARFVSDQVRQEILDEEVQELRDAVDARDLVQIADALADIVYVVAGTAVTYGLPFDAILAEVHRSNMSKFGPSGPRVREDGKIIKGPGYEPPSIAALLGEDGQQ